LVVVSILMFLQIQSPECLLNFDILLQSNFQKRLDVEIDWNCGPLGIYVFADMSVSFQELVFIVENKMTFEQVSRWYWEFWYGSPDNDNRVNIENYYKYFNGFKK